MEFQHYFYLAYVRRTFLCVSLQEMRPKSLASTMNSRVCTAASLGGLHVHICQVYESVREYVVCMCLCMCVCVYFYGSVQCTRICIHMHTCVYIYIYHIWMHFIVCVYIYMCIDCSKKWRNDTPSGRYARLPKPQMLAPENSKWSLCKFALQGVNVAPSSIVHKLDRNCLGRNNEHLGLTISRVSLRKLLQTP